MRHWPLPRRLAAGLPRRLLLRLCRHSTLEGGRYGRRLLLCHRRLLQTQHLLLLLGALLCPRCRAPLWGLLQSLLLPWRLLGALPWLLRPRPGAHLWCGLLHRLRLLLPRCQPARPLLPACCRCRWQLSAKGCIPVHQTVLCLHALLHFVHQARQPPKLLRQRHDFWVQAQAGQATRACPGLGDGRDAAKLLPLGALRVLLQALPQRCLVFLLVYHLLVHLVHLLSPHGLLGGLLGEGQLRQTKGHTWCIGEVVRVCLQSHV